jgi:diguanylate cyclase (GGDEF)-like protein
MNNNVKIQVLLNILDEVTERFDSLFELKERLLAETNYKATHDLLTNLYNREAFIKKVKELLSDEETKFCLAFVDLDNFKYVNDTFGHKSGDEILIATSNIMKNNLKGKDLVSRFGGDEFVILIQNCDENCAVRVLNTILKKIETTFRRFDVTASIGGVVFPKEGQTYEELLKKADKKMYQAKESGKGKVII